MSSRRCGSTIAAADARGFAEALQRQKGGLYRDVEVRTLVDRDATRAKCSTRSNGSTRR